MFEFQDLGRHSGRIRRCSYARFVEDDVYISGIFRCFSVQIGLSSCFRLLCTSKESALDFKCMLSNEDVSQRCSMQIHLAQDHEC
jgi:hypothetical protein